MLKKVVSIFKLYFFNMKWRKKNKHNFTTIKNIVPFSIISVGNYTYGNLNVIYFGEKNSGLKIGNYCSIANDTKFILGGEHNYRTISSYPFKSKLINGFDGIESFSKGKIIIEDDVWIGSNVIILSGVTIGKGSVIGAGSVVRKSVPPYSIYVDNKVIKKRFKESLIDKLVYINWDKIDEKFVNNNIDSFYTRLCDESELEFFEKLK